VLLLLFAVFAWPLRAADRPPNLIFILADDLGYGQLGCFGAKQIATPHLDRMAAEGIKFTRFYSGSPVCAPSRSVLMTGLHTGHTRVRGNGGAYPHSQDLRREDVTVAEVLKKVGYSTALIGKWGLGREGKQGLPNDEGFDYFYGYLDQGHAHNPYPEFVIRNKERVALRNRLVPGSGNNGAGIAQEPLDFVPDLMAAETLQWIEKQKDRPFFLYWSLITPHANNEGSKANRGQEVPDLGAYADKPWPPADKAHAATITRLDADIGRLFDLLKRLSIDEQTLVVFSSDNGAHKEGGNDPEFFSASGPLRGIKRALYEGGIRVPTVARWPGKTPAGLEERGAFWFADILPSFAALAGAQEVTASLDGGITLASLLRGAKIERAVRPVLYWEFHEKGFSQAVLMDERWKAVRNKWRDEPVEIYDTENDIGETKDLSGERADLVERAKALFVSERTESDDWPVKEAPAAK
jgi:arylsulfatase A-like enzyme